MGYRRREKRREEKRREEKRREEKRREEKRREEKRREEKRREEKRIYLLHIFLNKDKSTHIIHVLVLMHGCIACLVVRKKRNQNQIQNSKFQTEYYAKPVCTVLYILFAT